MKNFFLILLLFPILISAQTQNFEINYNSLAEMLNSPIGIQNTFSIKYRVNTNDGGLGKFKRILYDGSITNLGTTIKSTRDSSYVFKALLETPYKLTLPMFGGVGDGVTINNTAFTNILSTLTNLNGGTLYIPPGNWVLDAKLFTNGSIRIPSGVTIEGENKYTSVLTAITNSTGNNALLVIQTQKNITLKNFTLKGFNSTAPGGNSNNFGVCLFINSATNILVKDLILTNAYYDGFIVSTTDSNHLSDNLVFDGVWALGNRRIGGTVVGGRNIVIKNGIYAFSQGQPGENGIDIEGEGGNDIENIEVSNNIIYNNNGVGLYTQKGQGRNIRNVKLINNLVFNNGSYGIASLGIEDPFIFGNYSISNFSRGIYLQGGRGGKIINNIALSNNNEGINIVTSTDYIPNNLLIQGNTTAYNDVGMELRGINGLVQGNNIYSNKTHGVILTQGKNWGVNNNYIAANGQLTDYTYSGIFVTGGSEHNSFNGNVIRYSSIVSTNLAQTGTSNTITLNTIELPFDNFFKGETIVATVGVDVQTNVITAYNGSNRVATVFSPWISVPVTNSSYIIYDGKRQRFGITFNSTLDTGNDASVNDFYQSGGQIPVNNGGNNFYIDTPLQYYITNFVGVLGTMARQNSNNVFITGGQFQNLTSSSFSAGENLTFGNDGSIKIVSTNGVSQTVLVLNSSDNLQLRGSTVAGNNQYISRGSHTFITGPGITNQFSISDTGNVFVNSIASNKFIKTDGGQNLIGVLITVNDLPTNVVTGFSLSTNLIGLTPITGTSTNAMRGDSVRALSQFIQPVWQGQHIFFLTNQPQIQIQHDTNNYVNLDVTSFGVFVVENPGGSHMILSNNVFVVGSLDATGGFTVNHASPLNSILQSDGSAFVPKSITAFFNTMLTTKGDLLTYDGTNSVVVGVGSNGKVVMADSSVTNGWKWASITNSTGGGNLQSTGNSTTNSIAVYSDNTTFTNVTPKVLLGGTNIVITQGSTNITVNSSGVSGSGTLNDFAIWTSSSTIGTPAVGLYFNGGYVSSGSVANGINYFGFVQPISTLTTSNSFSGVPPFSIVSGSGADARHDTSSPGNFVAGSVITFICNHALGIRVYPNASLTGKIRVNGVGISSAGNAGGYIESTTIGSTIMLINYDGVGDNWLTMAVSGTWTVN